MIALRRACRGGSARSALPLPVVLIAVVLIAPAQLVPFPRVVGAPLGAVALRAQDAPAEADDLPDLARKLADRWAEGEVRGLEGLLSPRGIAFHMGSTRQTSLEPRKALAAVGDLLDSRRSVSCSVVRVGPAAGGGDRGFAELVWASVAPGTSEVLRQTVFLGFHRSDGRWRINEIRVLP